MATLRLRNLASVPNSNSNVNTGIISLNNFSKHYLNAPPVDQLTTFIRDLLRQPPFPYNPANQTLKGWIVYILRDRGLIVETSVSNADLRVKSKVGEVRFKVSDHEVDLDPSVAWIILEAGGNSAKVIPAQVPESPSA